MIYKTKMQEGLINTILENELDNKYPGVHYFELTNADYFIRDEDDDPNVPLDVIVHEARHYRISREYRLTKCSMGELKNIMSKSRTELIEIDSAEQAKKTEAQLFFNRSEATANFEHWGRAAYWSAEEATALSFGKNPKRVTKHNLIELALGMSPFVQTFKDRLFLIERAVQHGDLDEQIVPARLLMWLQENDLSIAEEWSSWSNQNHTEISSHISPRVSTKRFSELDSLEWGEITLTLLSGGHLQISARDVTKKVPLDDLDLMNRTTNKPNRLFTLLTAFARKRGTLEITSKPKDQASDLRNSLKAFFALTTNPIPAEGRHWALRFKLIDQRDAPDKRAKAKALRKTVAFDENDLSHQISSETVSRDNSDEYPHDDETDATAEWIEENDN